MKTLVLSDLHLGSKASQAAARLSDIARIAAGFDRVILNGDTLDRCYVNPQSDARLMQLIADVQKYCASRNGPPELLTGNHDPVISDVHHLYDEPSQTLIFHGDCIRDCTHPTKKTDQQLMAKLMQRWQQLGGRPTDFVALHENYREVQRLELPIINPYKKSKTITQYALSLVYPPRRPFDIIHYWMKAPERALETAASFARPVKQLIVGHTHRPGHWRIRGTDVYNLGSFMPFSGAYGLTLDGANVSFVELKQLMSGTRKVVSLSTPDRDSKLAGERS